MATKPVKYFLVDAFTDSAFKGNPAAVCVLEEERDRKWLQAVAAELNAPMTAYLIRITDGNSTPKFRLRWFTTLIEVEICGHATLASAHVLFASGLADSNMIEFDTVSGILTAKRIREGGAEVEEIELIELDFPVIPSIELNSADVSLISNALNVASIIDIKRTTANILLVVLPTEKEVIDFEPNFDEIRKFPEIGMIITGVSPEESGFDFYSRVFFPKVGVNEDAVCGSAHCALAAYWSAKLGKFDLVAYAASSRGGILKIHVDNDRQRVMLRGKAVTTIEGLILV